MQRKTRTRMAGLAFLAVILPSCLMYTHNGGTTYFPEGSHRDTHTQRLVVTVNGARGHAYVEHTLKTVFVTWKARDGQVLLHRKYTVEAGDVRWATRGVGENGFEAAFYERAEGGNASAKQAVRQVLALKYNGKVLDDDTGVREVPEWVQSAMTDGR